MLGRGSCWSPTPFFATTARMLIRSSGRMDVLMKSLEGSREEGKQENEVPREVVSIDVTYLIYLFRSIAIVSSMKSNTPFILYSMAYWLFMWRHSSFLILKVLQPCIKTVHYQAIPPLSSSWCIYGKAAPAEADCVWINEDLLFPAVSHWFSLSIVWQHQALQHWG